MVRSFVKRLALLATLVVTTLPCRAAAAPPQAVTEPATEPAPTLRQSAPDSGVGLVTSGTFVMLGGLSLVVSTSYLMATTENNWAGAIAGGTLLTGAGATLVWLGTRRIRKLRAWEAETGLDVPPDGRALLISGLILGGGSAVSMIAYGGLSLGYCEQNCFNPDQGLWFGLAGTGLAAGIGMVVGAIIVRHRHHRWRALDAGVQVRVTPTFALAPGGAAFGVAGRF